MKVSLCERCGVRRPRQTLAQSKSGGYSCRDHEACEHRLYTAEALYQRFLGYLAEEQIVAESISRFDRQAQAILA